MHNKYWVVNTNIYLIKIYLVLSLKEALCQALGVQQ